LSLLALGTLLFLCPPAATADPEKTRTVVFLYPDSNDGRPGNLRVDQGLRSTFTTGSSERIIIHNEYLDLSRPVDDDYWQQLATFLQRKYAGRKIDLVIAGLASALDFALEHRDQVFPGVPVVFCAVDQREVTARPLPPDVVGVPSTWDLAATLDVALRLHPNTRHVFVIAGGSPFDVQWAARARDAFRGYEDKLAFTYLTGLPLNDLVKETAQLPDKSVIYYLHVFQDDTGKALIPAHVLELLAATANAPIYGHVDTYIGRGIVGGRVFSFETEGKHAANIGLRILAGEKPETISVPETSENTYMFDRRQLRRWGIGEASLPPGSVVRHQEPDFWGLYKWHVAGGLSLCVLQALLIAGLLVQRASRRRAEEGLRASQRELRVLHGKLLRAQERERRRIARDLHDDLNQSLALLSVELDLLGQKPPESAGQLGTRLQELSSRVKQLSSAVHALSHQLHPLKLEQMGLVAAVRALSKELSHSHGLPIEFTHYRLPEALPDDTALCLYRIVQEALRNVLKHSGARHAEVELSGSAGMIRLRVVDDGAGFDPRSVNGKGGLGLVSMRERLVLVGGAIAIEARPSGGTQIDVRVPLGATDQAEGILPADSVQRG
jgi:signal transduction histidine kinase